MSETVEKLRNIALVGHGGAGKTSMAEVMLYKAGVTNRIGSVEDGNTAMDFEPEELKRQSSISGSFHQFNWKKHTVNIIDTPGDQNFFNDTIFCMQAADCALFVIDGVDGIKVQTEQGWEYAKELNLPCVVFINKLDRERSDFTRTLEEAREILDPKPIIVQLPIGKETEFKGVVDLVRMKAFTYNADGKVSEIEIPPDMKDTVEAEREAFIENVAESDDALIERYLEGEELTDDDIKAALKKGLISRIFAPVLCGSATSNIGVDLLLDFIADSVPSPADRGVVQGHRRIGRKRDRFAPPTPRNPLPVSSLKPSPTPMPAGLTIFRVVSGTLGEDGTFYNTNKGTRERFNQLMTIAGKEQKPAKRAVPGSIVAVAKLKETTTGDTLCAENRKVRFAGIEPMPTLISYALTAKSKGDEDKIYGGLTKLMEEDMGLKLDRNAETKEILLSGMGQIHIEIAVEKLKRKYNVEAVLNIPKVPYRETIKKKVRVQGRHKKQTGGHGQFGDCWIQVEPLPRGGGFEFVDSIVGGAIPRQYIPAVEKGIVESCQKGVLAGFPCIDFRITLDDGSYHAVDSSEMAFKIAGSMAFKKATEHANPVLLEPIMEVTITAPDEFMGDIMGNLNSRRGRVLGMDSAGRNQVVKAHVPMAEFLTYAPDLRSMTGGRGIFTMEFSHYDEVPAQVAEKVIADADKNQE